MISASTQSGSYRAVSVKVAPLFDSEAVPLQVTMDNGDDLTVICTAESLFSLQDELQRQRLLRAARAMGAMNDDVDAFADNAAGS